MELHEQKDFRVGLEITVHVLEMHRRLTLDKDLINRINETGERAARLKEKKNQEFWKFVVECASILREIHPNQRRLWLSDVIDELYHVQNGLCALCDSQLEPHLMQVDHIIPFTYGGGNERTNLQLAHAECNNKKRANVDAWDLIKYLECRYMNLPPNDRIRLISS
jgi:5-methylcytosine-specific restriction endonuclease McrA